MMYAVGDRVKVRDPAGGRKWLPGTVIRVNEGRGPTEYLVKVDGIPQSWGCEPGELRSLRSERA